ELVLDLSFQPFTINLQKISIVIYSIGISVKQGTEYGFASFFIYSKSKECILVFQTVNKDRYSICIYKENQISEEYCRSDPNNFLHSIHNTKIHGCVFGNRCPATPKPSIRKKIMPQKHEDQFEWFMSNNETMNLSSYKVDTKTGLPLKHLDLERLCSTYSTYEYGVSENLMNLIMQNIEDQACLLKNIEASKQFLKCDYLKHLHVTSYRTVSHKPCINYCLLFAFGNCNKEHMLDCDKCNEIFKLFEELQLLLENKQQEILKEL
ncbi:6325_t:CDS:2, partial [Gigaspora rosea]